MSFTRIDGFQVSGVSTCVPPRAIDNSDCGTDYGVDEVRKVIAMAGVRYRHVVQPGVTSADLSFEAAERLLESLGWSRESISGLIFVTQTPDYFLPSSSCLLHKWLGLSDQCAAFDVGLGCSGYPYGLYLAGTMLKAGGHRRILMLHGETPSRLTSPDDHATTLLFGDVGSATAIEMCDTSLNPAFFCLQSDGQGYDTLILPGGGFRDRSPSDPRDLFVRMDGAAVFNFTIQRVPPMIRDTLAFADLAVEDIDWYLFHQSNRFIMKHLAKKCGLPEQCVPFVLDRFGNSGGASVALAFTQGIPETGRKDCRAMTIGYGVGLSWGAGIVQLGADAPLLHSIYTGTIGRA
ncbi:ketoacyl-ACP synthase III [Thiocapsa marina]|uniref:Beta-ketoacyl-acyl-carrier-protein synthase III n=1 Tax=Thiocapsa marina 5811 TaxID=768671 RepID=F9UAT8_9GAMM|nr:ketoacyl-ACP synthase III [Thiocapsa marina]EGV18556.1 Beta-ketoacyl-acyl-carrier-protein synthase III [Thiocapsa marina 5811]